MPVDLRCGGVGPSVSKVEQLCARHSNSHISATRPLSNIQVSFYQSFHSIKVNYYLAS